MDELLLRIRTQIEQSGGWIGFDEFMHQALYCPQLGYYCGAGEPFPSQKSLTDGDFVTAPMLGPWLAKAICPGHSPFGRRYAKRAVRQLPCIFASLAAGEEIWQRPFARLPRRVRSRLR